MIQWLVTVTECRGIALVTKLINMAEAQKSLGKATAAYNSAPCQGDGCMSSRPLPLM